MIDRGPYTLRLTAAANDLLSGAHPQLKKKIRAAFEALLRDPYSGKGLQRELAGYWTYRVGSYRIVYRPESRRVDVIAFGPRERIYEETYRLVKAESRKK